MTEIKRLTQFNSHEYYDLIHRAYQSIDAETISFAAASDSEAEMSQWLDEHLTYGLFAQGQLVCALSIRFPWSKSKSITGYPHLGRFATHPEFQGHGYAKQLLAWVEKNIIKDLLHSPYLTLGTAENHPWLRQFYETQGFLVYDRKKLPNNKHVTLYFKKEMEL
ncbi:MAG: GNAT family N-acetyltransferase [Streptococcaceae bacterium]|jgi:GNAT superfamily N-acetyltransferase|nr:GNAT family N-acetyltransferase [Streptococcaceae bacterium]MCH4177835.1 GNAT family N-acetyltransferase [Streptococcaceae bacterium]